MTVDDFLARVKSQSTIIREGFVRIWGSELKSLFASGRTMTIAELNAHPDQTEELRQFRDGHLVGPGLAPADIDAWQSHSPQHQLPADVVDLLTRVNGIHLWADLDAGRAYIGILPLQDWQDATQWFWRSMYTSTFEGQLVISYHGNNDEFLILDTCGPRYLWYDLGNFGAPPKQIATTVEGLLDWWWHEADKRERSMEKYWERKLRSSAKPGP